jgi:serine/threonine-protein kinase
MRDVEFLALLVHRGLLPRERAQDLVRRLGAGAALDPLLIDELGWEEALVQRLRRTRCGEAPEIPGYEIGEKLGSGGTADVFRARDTRTRAWVALKVLKPEATRHEATRRAFVAEARLLEELRHPGLVRCFGVARSGTTYFSRLGLVEGATLLEELDRGRAFSEEEALRIVLETAEALEYLEGEGVVHRDVKPGNIMLDQDGHVVLIDLGFAAAEGSAAVSTDSTVGTVAYLSPEQARGGARADSRSDIYSLGLSLFHIVVGRLPFEGSDDRELLRMQVMDSLSSPELKSRGISPHLQYFIEKMVAKEADHRYQSWSELIADVRAQLAGRQDLDLEGMRAKLRAKGERFKRR